MQSEPILKIQNIDVFHGGFQAIWNLSMEVREGEACALIGANTAGKSTLLDTINGVNHPKSGSITFMGQDISKLEPFEIVDLGITQVPEGRRLFPEMTVMDNLIMGSYTPNARKHKDKNLQRVFDLFPKLKDRQKQLAKTMSGGEQQMVAIGRGLMANPKLIMIDEMSLGLAPIIVDEIFKTLHKIKAQGVTVLFVEQNVVKTLKEADRAYIIETGKITLSGTALELRDNEDVRKAYFGV
ncbi:ABC transporter ATP-binding protein [Holophaga foetida]|uniref:ABC transporter ATP-binding protein n=1 Tax=Holophaga foetida TaxID=35839 RepID=UPI000247180C|nr:ABC transporter ATP-binding protein [Holophaga foetida]